MNTKMPNKTVIDMPVVVDRAGNPIEFPLFKDEWKTTVLVPMTGSV